MKTIEAYTAEEFEAKWPAKTFVYRRFHDTPHEVKVIRAYDRLGDLRIDRGTWMTDTCVGCDPDSKHIDVLCETIAVLTEIRDFIERDGAAR